MRSAVHAQDPSQSLALARQVLHDVENLVAHLGIEGGGRFERHAGWPPSLRRSACVAGCATQEALPPKTRTKGGCVGAPIATASARTRPGRRRRR